MTITPIEKLPKSWQASIPKAVRRITRELTADPTADIADLSYDAFADYHGTPPNDNTIRYERWLDWRTHVESQVTNA